MQTSFPSSFGCLCLSPSCPPVPALQSQKHVTLKQIISYKKQFESKSTVPKTCKDKLSLLQYKKSKQVEMIQPKPSMNNKEISRRKVFSNITVINANSYPDKLQFLESKESEFGRLKYDNLKTFNIQHQVVFENKLVSRNPIVIKNIEPSIPQYHPPQINNMVLHHNVKHLPHYYEQCNRIPANSYPIKHPFLTKQLFQNYGEMLEMKEQQDAQKFLRSEQLTMSTKQSNDNVRIKVQHQYLMMSAESHKYNFPQGFRKAQSLQDEDSIEQQLSLVLNNLSIEEKLGGARSEREPMHIAVKKKRSSQSSSKDYKSTANYEDLERS